MKAIVDKADADTLPLRATVIGSASVDILRDNAGSLESAMGNLVADAMRAKYAGGSTRRSPTPAACGQDIFRSPPSAGEAGR